MLVSMSWVRSLLWTTFLHISVQYQEPDTTYSAMLTRHLAGPDCFPIPNTTCAWQDRDGGIYNLDPLISSSSYNKSSGFTVNGTVHEGYPGYYSYSYNPCGWLSLGGDCKRKSKAVVCSWVWNLKSDNNIFRAIGTGKPNCRMRFERLNPLSLEYKASKKKLPHRKATVRLICKLESTEPIFRVINENDWTFFLIHKCACKNGCPIPTERPTTATSTDITTVITTATTTTKQGLEGEPYTCTTRPPYPGNLLILAAAGGGTVIFLFVPFLVWWFVRKERNNNNEGQPLLNNAPDGQRANEIYNAIEQPNLESRSRPIPVTSPRNKDDNIRSANT